MDKIHITENPKGTFSCDVGITVGEWQEILTDTHLTTLMSSQKKMILACSK